LKTHHGQLPKYLDLLR